MVTVAIFRFTLYCNCYIRLYLLYLHYTCIHTQIPKSQIKQAAWLFKTKALEWVLIWTGYLQETNKNKKYGGIRFFRLPKDDKKLKKKWLISIRKSLQKQPLEVFFEKRCSEKFGKILRKIPVLESLFNKVAVLRLCPHCTHYQTLHPLPTLRSRK